MNFDALYDQLNIRIGDTDNFTFTQEEKQDALREAFNDEYTKKPIWDSSLTYASGTYQYARPSGVDVIQDIYIKADNSLEEPEKIASTLWEVVGSNIHFKKGSEIIPDGYTLYLKGYTKYDENDTIAETAIQEYVMNLAQLKLLRMLGVKKALRFLKNDTSMAEVVTIKRELEAEVRGYQRRQPTAWEAA